MPVPPLGPTLGVTCPCFPGVQVVAHRLHLTSIDCLEVHPATGLLVTGGDDGCIRLWHLPALLRCPAGQQAPAQRGLATHWGSISSCPLSSCGGFLASCAFDGTIRLWSTCGDREPLAVLTLQASSVAFAPGDDAALLVAAKASADDDQQQQGQQQQQEEQGPPSGPLLLDLRRVPACQHYCAQLAAAQAGRQHRGGGHGRQARAAAASVHPATAVWLPAAAEAAAAGAAATPRLRGRQQGAAAQGARALGSQQEQSGGGSGGSGQRRVGSGVSYGRRRHQRQQEAAEAEAEVAAATAEELAAAGDEAGAEEEADAEQHEHSVPMRPLTCPLSSGWTMLLPPSSPASAAAHDGCVPASAVAASYAAECCETSGGTWDADSRSFVYRQVGAEAVAQAAVTCAGRAHACSMQRLRLGLHLHSALCTWPPTELACGAWHVPQGGHAGAVRWLLPLPEGLHVLTATEEGEAKLWTAVGGGMCCTLVPDQLDHLGHCLPCRPAVTADGRYVVSGGTRGTLSCWDLQQLQREAHLPLNHRDGNAAAACRAHQAAVTAVAVGQDSGDTLVASGDASGRLMVCWR